MLAYLEQSTSCTNKTRYVLMMHRKLSVVRGQAFIKKITEVIISPQAQWKVRVIETDSDCVI